MNADFHKEVIKKDLTGATAIARLVQYCDNCSLHSKGFSGKLVFPNTEKIRYCIAL